jgi:hypothetical protein
VRLPKSFESLQVDPELLQDSVEQRRTNLTPAMHWNGRRPAIRVSPPLVASGLARSLEPEFGGHTL